MRPYPILLSIAIAIALPTQASAGEDIADLYQFNCISCHGAEVYTRTDRKVTSLEGLDRQVRRCELALGLKWFDEEIADMTGYLNTHYYKFQP
jgi:stalled ribosome rescue protein Dom34